jgi:hypothetical protein
MMNERIQDLWTKAAESTAAYPSGQNNSWETQVNFIEKFAELVVRECIGCCEQVISDPVPESVDTWLNGGSQCISEIKQHFGVEE